MKRTIQTDVTDMKEVIRFIRDLSVNNDKDWFDANRQRWNECQDKVRVFTSELVREMTVYDAGLKGLRPEDCLWRIYRDVRFSRDKSPYKSWIGIFMCPGGKRSGNAGYYLHLEGLPQGSAPNMLYAGLHLPQPAVLRGLRRMFVSSGDIFERCIGMAEGFSLDMSQSLSRNPAGFPKDSPHGQLLRLSKDIGVVRMAGDGFITEDGAVKRIASEFGKAAPFVQLLNRSVEEILTEGRLG